MKPANDPHLAVLLMLESSFPVSLPSSHGPLCSMDGDFIGCHVITFPITLLSISVFLTHLSFLFPLLQLLSPLFNPFPQVYMFLRKVLEISLAHRSSRKKQPESLTQASVALNGFCVIIHLQVLPVDL